MFITRPDASLYCLDLGAGPRTLLGVGGWIGAWIGMSWFRHKTQKQPFRRWAVLWTIVNPTWLLVWWSITSQK